MADGNIATTRARAESFPQFTLQWVPTSNMYHFSLLGHCKVILQGTVDQELTNWIWSLFVNGVCTASQMHQILKELATKAHSQARMYEARI
jgi:hypothetical protein